MYLKCYDLMKLPIFKNIQLVGGASGLNRQISWIYVSTTPSLESWLRGGELVFIVHNSNLKQRLQEAVTSQAAGVVVLKSADNRSVLDQDEIDFANQFDLPLFEMDYHVRLVDVTREVSIGIMSRQKKSTIWISFFIGSFFRLIWMRQLQTTSHCILDFNRGTAMSSRRSMLQPDPCWKIWNLRCSFTWRTRNCESS